MKIRRILAICFSATGTTERSLRQILESLRPLNAEETEFLNLADRDADLASLPASGREDLIVVAAPVYFGRIPEIMASKLQNLSAESAPAVAMVVYGNREYDDALLELCDILSQRDCYVAGAGAFLAQHSIFPKVASGRPDASDLAALKDFGDACCRYLRNVADVGRIPPIRVQGNYPYKESRPVSPKPSADSGLCGGCGVCAQKCPAGAIPASDPTQTDTGLCISCGRCISICTRGARRHRGIVYTTAAAAFSAKLRRRRDPQWHLAESDA